MILSDLERIVDSIEKEKNIPRDVLIEILEQAIGIGGDAHHPLLQRTFEDREVATVASAIARFQCISRW